MGVRKQILLIAGAMALVASLGAPAVAAEPSNQADESLSSLSEAATVDGDIGINDHCPSSIATPYRYTSPSGYHYVYQSTYNDCPSPQYIITQIRRYVSGSWQHWSDYSDPMPPGYYAWNMRGCLGTYSYRTFLWVEAPGHSVGHQVGSSRSIACGSGKA
jgi:hypothetical protein